MNNKLYNSLFFSTYYNYSSFNSDLTSVFLVMFLNTYEKFNNKLYNEILV